MRIVRITAKNDIAFKGFKKRLTLSKGLNDYEICTSYNYVGLYYLQTGKLDDAFSVVSSEFIDVGEGNFVELLSANS